MPSSRGSSQSRDQTQVSHIAGRFFTIWATRETHLLPRKGIVSARSQSSEHGCKSFPGSGKKKKKEFIDVGLFLDEKTVKTKRKEREREKDACVCVCVCVCVCMCVCICMLSLFSCVRLFATLWTVARPALGFLRQEHWSGLPCSPPGDVDIWWERETHLWERRNRVSAGLWETIPEHWCCDHEIQLLSFLQPV